MFSAAEELKGVLKEKYQREYEEFIAQEAKKVSINTIPIVSLLYHYQLKILLLVTIDLL